MLRTTEIHDLIDDCKFYKDSIRTPSYIKNWTKKSESHYKNKRCRKLLEGRLNDRSRNFSNRSFYYKNNQRLEPFVESLYKDKIINIIILIIFFVFIGLIIFYK
jgi:hypothetical protein